MEKQNIYLPKPPYIYFTEITEDDRKFNADYIYKRNKCQDVVRVLRGNKMKTVQSLMDEFGAALQFFEDFGENWHALGECLCYLDEWLPADSYILIITNAQDVLIDEDADQLKWFLNVVNETGIWWSRPIKDNGRYNRKSIPFHVIFKYEKKFLEQLKNRFCKFNISIQFDM